jgi:hypothetical protein
VALVLLALEGPVGLVLGGPGGRPLEALTLLGRPLVGPRAILNNTQSLLINIF